MTDKDFKNEGAFPPTKVPDACLTRLASGILIQAFRDIIKSPGGSKKSAPYRRDAIEWFAAQDDYPGSFLWVCSILKTDPARVRLWLRAYIQSSERERQELAKSLNEFTTPR